MSLPIAVPVDVESIRGIIGLPTLISTSAIAAAVLVSLPSFSVSWIKSATGGLGGLYAVGAALAIIDGGLVKSNWLCSFSYLFVLFATSSLALSFLVYVYRSLRERGWRGKKQKRETVIEREVL